MQVESDVENPLEVTILQVVRLGFCDPVVVERPEERANPTQKIGKLVRRVISDRIQLGDQGLYTPPHSPVSCFDHSHRPQSS